jgi:hypothetical protein
LRAAMLVAVQAGGREVGQIIGSAVHDSLLVFDCSASGPALCK